MNLKLRLLIVVLLLISSIIVANEWKPLTYEEVIDYMKNAGVAQVVKDLQRLDFLENNNPVIPDPWYTAMLLKNGTLIIFPTKHNLTANHGHLLYGVKFRTYTITEFAPPEKKLWPWVALAITAGTGIGLVIGWMAGR